MGYMSQAHDKDKLKDPVLSPGQEILVRAVRGESCLKGMPHEYR